MSKVMIVEDDDSLREIYGIRLAAEGYTVVSAHDGEEALAVAVKERPDLIVSDVMMPKISGFDMLDILRSTPETANIKVIMMTALSSDDQRDRGENLGADRYLVKSQVGIEDVVNVVHDVLGDRNGEAIAAATTEIPATSSIPQQPTQSAAQPTAQPTTQPAAQPAAQPAFDPTSFNIPHTETSAATLGNAQPAAGAVPMASASASTATAPTPTAAPLTPEAPAATTNTAANTPSTMPIPPAAPTGM